MRDYAEEAINARAAAQHAAGELHTLLTVYGDDIPDAVKASMTKLQKSLAEVAQS